MGQEKALLEIPGHGMSFLAAAIGSLKPHTEVVLVVAGRNAEKLKPIVFARGADLVINPDPDRGQFSSLQVGLQDLLNRGRNLALITHVDRPPVASPTITALKTHFARTREVPGPERKWLLVPEYQGIHGHPVLAGREMIEQWLRAPANSTARAVEHALQGRIGYLDVPDANVIKNVNTPDEYARLADQK